MDAVVDGSLSWYRAALHFNVADGGREQRIPRSVEQADESHEPCLMGRLDGLVGRVVCATRVSVCGCFEPDGADLHQPPGGMTIDERRTTLISGGEVASLGPAPARSWFRRR